VAPPLAGRVTQLKVTLGEQDLTPFVPGARRAVAGHADHSTAPSDPLFHSELIRFLQAGS
jgi:hypothetical protein